MKEQSDRHDHHLLRILSIGALLVGGAVGLGWLVYRHHKHNPDPHLRLALRIEMLNCAITQALAHGAPEEHIRNLIRLRTKLERYQSFDSGTVSLLLALDSSQEKMRISSRLPCGYSK